MSENIHDVFGLSDDDLDQRAAEYESGTWGGDLSTVTMGRPPLYDEQMRHISVRVPASELEAIDARAHALGQNRSTFLRHAIENALRAG